MKALLATAVTAIVISAGSPATAQVYNNQNQWGYWNNQALGAYARAPLAGPQRNFAFAQRSDGRIHSPNPAFDVYDTNNRYVSSDPDPFIRNDLARNAPGRGDD